MWFSFEHHDACLEQIKVSTGPFGAEGMAFRRPCPAMDKIFDSREGFLPPRMNAKKPRKSGLLAFS
jgi:hypothetical protein